MEIGLFIIENDNEVWPFSLLILEIVITANVGEIISTSRKRA